MIRFVAAPIFLFLLLPIIATAQNDSTLWGDAVDGTSIGISLQPPARTNWHPGEILQVVEFFRARKSARIPSVGLGLYTEIHLIMPDNHEYIWQPPHIRQRRQAATQRATAWTKWDSEGPYTYDLRLADSSEIWIDAKTNQLSPISLRKPGTYKIFSVCEIHAGATAPKTAWHGKVQSGAISFTISDLPIDKRLLELTPEQKTLLDSWIAGKEVGEDLRRAVELTENEALAGRLVTLMKQQKPKRATLTYKILSQRVGTIQDGDQGIDGPYLKELANWVLDVNEGKFRSRPKLSLLGGIQHAVIYLDFHPDDVATKNRTLAILKEWCRLPSVRAPGDTRPLQSLAWQSLLKLHALTDNTPKSQALEILGPPQSSTASQLQWTLTTPQQDHPATLTAHQSNDTLSSWRISP